MTKSNVTPNFITNVHPRHIIDPIENATEIIAPRPYKKYLPAITPALRQIFLHATGEIEYQATLNYMFQALFQENEEALTNLICAILH